MLAISVSSDGIALITSGSFSLVFLVLMKELTLAGKIGTSQHFESKGGEAVQADVAEYSPAVGYQLRLRGARIGNTPKPWTLCSKDHMLHVLAFRFCSLL